jgi:hypothetical protein
LRAWVTAVGSRWRITTLRAGVPGSCVLPIERAVRDAEDLDVSDTATATVEPTDL